MDAVIIGGFRTGFGSFGGSLRDVTSEEMGVLVCKAATKGVGLNPRAVEQVCFGNVIQTGRSGIYLTRHISLKAGFDVGVSCLTVNRLCGSGLESIAQIAGSIQLSQCEVGIAGGVESMSQSPFLAEGVRWGQKMGNSELVDALMAGLRDEYAGLAMGETAEKLSEIYNISREDQDVWARLSQKRAESAQKSGRLAREIAPVVLRSRKGETKFETDEFVRGEAKSAGLSELPAAFKKGGSVTAGNSSGINDGASAVVITSEDFARKNSLKPLARILGWAAKGCAPDVMGMGPVHAIPEALRRANLKLSQMDLIEVNEAFAAQFLAVKKELGLDESKTNVNGGAIAIGHPLGASGNRILLTLALELRERKLKYGCASLCIGGGQGIAMVIEAL